MSTTLDADVLLIQRDSLRDALTKLLDTREREAKAYLSYQVAIDNFGFDGNPKEAQIHLEAMNAASKAEREARALLLTLKA